MLTIRNLIRKNHRLYVLAMILRGHQAIAIDYPVNPQPRYGWGRPAHPQLQRLLERRRDDYRQLLSQMLQFKPDFLRIPVAARHGSSLPAWVNGWLPGLDAAALYGLLCLKRPDRYFEIGSGHSTRFARRAVDDHQLPTRITSIDPHPRAETDAIADRCIRRPLEEIDLSLFDEVEPGDFVFLDGSHRCFTNSDVTVFVLDVLPRLPRGTIVQMHDILLPYDYPIHLKEFYYSEQYLLAAHLLAQGERARVLLPNAFVTQDDELSAILAPLWDERPMPGVERCGSSFWFEAG